MATRWTAVMLEFSTRDLIDQTTLVRAIYQVDPGTEHHMEGLRLHVTDATVIDHVIVTGIAVAREVIHAPDQDQDLDLVLGVRSMVVIGQETGQGIDPEIALEIVLEIVLEIALEIGQGISQGTDQGIDQERDIRTHMIHLLQDESVTSQHLPHLIPGLLDLDQEALNHLDHQIRTSVDREGHGRLKDADGVW